VADRLVTSDGVATWYSGAIGECGPLIGMFAASKTIACHAKVRVTYRGKAVYVTILDRLAQGPQSDPSSGIDLAPAAFSQLAPLSVGVLHGVRIEIVGAGDGAGVAPPAVALSGRTTRRTAARTSTTGGSDMSSSGCLSKVHDEILPSIQAISDGIPTGGSGDDANIQAWKTARNIWVTTVAVPKMRKDCGPVPDGSSYAAIAVAWADAVRSAKLSPLEDLVTTGECPAPFPQVFCDLLAALLSPSTWLRFGGAIAGAILVLLAIYLLAKKGGYL